MKKKGFLIVLLLMALGFFFAGCQEVVPTISLSETTFTTEVGETATLKAAVSVEGLELEYSTSNQAVATVSQAGLITAVSAGQATITVAIKEHPEITATATVIVKANPPITVSLASAQIPMYIGGTYDIVSFVTGTAATAVTYTSANVNVATVTAAGKITAVAAGTTKITVALASDASIKAEVTVVVTKTPELEDWAPTSITILGQDEMYVDETELFLTMVLPANANKTLIWSTNDPSVAIVDAEGNVTPLKTGFATITAKSAIKGTVVDSYDVEVLERGLPMEIIDRAIDFLKAELPIYVNASFDLPVYPNHNISVRWLDGNGAPMTEQYPYTTPAQDSRTNITMQVEYGNSMKEATHEIRLVTNLEDNLFLRNELIETYLKVHLDDYIRAVDPLNVNGNLFLPTSLKGGTITWQSNTGSVLTSAGVFTKPDNDTVVRLTATINGMANVVFEVTAQGLTEDEKFSFLYNQGVLSGLKELSTNADVTLPTHDPRFNKSLSWESSHPDVFDNTGKFVNRDLAADVDVVFTLTIQGLVKTFEVPVKALAATDVSKAVFDFLLDDELLELIPTYFAYGEVGREGGNTISGLPTTLTGHEGVTITWEGNPEYFDGLTLKTQYLRYRMTTLTATFSKEGVPSSSTTFPLNVGIADVMDTIYVGGRFSEQTSTKIEERWDLLNTFSAFDKMVGNTTYKDQNFWSFYSGYSFFIDGKWDVVDGVDVFVQNHEEGRRYHYFAMDFVVIYITAVAEDGTPTFEKSNLRDGDGGNWGIFFVNLTDKVAKIPLATHAAGNDSEGNPWAGQGTREHAITFDGFRVGFTADEDGTIVQGNGKRVFQEVFPNTTKFVDVPANGYGMTFKTQQNQPDGVGVFAQPGNQLTILKHDLHGQNDFRVRRFNTNLNNVETALDLLEAGDTTTINVEVALSTAKTLRNHPLLNEAEIENFDDDRFDALVARSAAYWSAQIADIKTEQEEEDYLTDLKVLFTKYANVIEEVKALIVDREWFEDECDLKLANYEVALQLNGGEFYTATRQEVVDLFMADLYAHLADKAYPDLPATLEAFTALVVASPSLLTDDFMFEWVLELHRDNADHLTVDNTAKQFMRQEAYNAKWKPLMYWVNDTVQTGHNGGRDFLGRVGLPYLWTYLTPTSYAGEVVYVGTTFGGRFSEYLRGNYAYPAFRNLFLQETWTIGADASQAKADDKPVVFTAGDPLVTLPKVVKPGNVFAGWFLDEDLNVEASLKGRDLGFNNVTLYAKWWEVDELFTVKFFDGETELTNLEFEYCELESYTLPVMEKDGYTFHGWFDNAEFTGDAVTEIPLESTGDKTFFAKFVEIPFSEVAVTYDLNGGRVAPADFSTYVPGKIVATRYGSMDWSGTGLIIHTGGSANWNVIGIKPSGIDGIWEVVGKGNVASIEGATRYIMYHENCTSDYLAAISAVYATVAAGWLVVIPNMPTVATNPAVINMNFLAPADLSNDVVETRLWPGDSFAPIKDGFTFAGWCLEEDLSDDPFTGFPGIAKELELTEVTFYAKWTAVVPE